MSQSFALICKKCSVFAIALMAVLPLKAQDVGTFVRRVMEGERNGKYIQVDVNAVGKLNSQELKALITPFLSDSLPQVRTRAYGLLGQAVLLKKDTIQRQSGLHLLVTGLKDQDSGVCGEVCSWLPLYHRNDFGLDTQKLLGEIVVQRPHHYAKVVKILGFVGAEDYIPLLQNQLALSQAPLDKLALRQALARMGHREQLDYFKRKLADLPADDAIMYRLGPLLAYVRQPETIDYLISVLLSDEKNCSSPNPDYDGQIRCAFKAMELLAQLMKDYPIPVDEDGFIDVDDYEEALVTVRDWFLNHPEDYSVNWDRY